MLNIYNLFYVLFEYAYELFFVIFIMYKYLYIFLTSDFINKIVLAIFLLVGLFIYISFPKIAANSIIASISIYNGQILYALHKTKDSTITVHMKSKYYNRSKKYEFFRNDFDNIISIAKEKNNTISIVTHKLLIGKILRHFGYKSSYFRKIEKLRINETVIIGNMQITRRKDRVNICAKYEYPGLSKFKNFKKTITPVEMYDIKISL